MSTRLTLPFLLAVALTGCSRVATLDLSIDVRDENGAAVPGALATISANDRAIKTLTADSKGHFSFSHDERYNCDLEYCEPPTFSMLVQRSALPEAASSRRSDLHYLHDKIVLLTAPTVSLDANGLSFDLGAHPERSILVDGWLPWQPSEGPLPLALLLPGAKHTARAADVREAYRPYWGRDANNADFFSDVVPLDIPDPPPVLALTGESPWGDDNIGLTDGSYESAIPIEGSSAFDIALPSPTSFHSIGMVGVTASQRRAGAISLDLRTTTEVVLVPASACQIGTDWILCAGDFVDVKHVLVKVTGDGLDGVSVAEVMVR